MVFIFIFNAMEIIFVLNLLLELHVCIYYLTLYVFLCGQNLEIGRIIKEILTFPNCSWLEVKSYGWSHVQSGALYR